MKERPILFSAPMIRALLAGTKTQTRRIMNPQPEHLQHYEYKGEVLYDGEHRLWWWKRRWFDLLLDSKHERNQLAYSNPYGAPGDRLWVRETHTIVNGSAFYRADGPWPQAYGPEPKWKPSIFMPRWASRISLEVTGVRVERLHEITEEDARAEGCTGVPDVVDVTPREEYEQLWCAINGAESWRSNPWVWVVEFHEHASGGEGE